MNKGNMIVKFLNIVKSVCRLLLLSLSREGVEILGIDIPNVDNLDPRLGNRGETFSDYNLKFNCNENNQSNE
jgi:hypothetical protein